MMGISWGGFNALQVAARRPPSLGAVVTVSFTDDRYADDVHYMGGCLLTDNLSWASTMFAYNSCPPDPEVVGERWRDMWHERLRGSGLWLREWLRHQRRDALLAARLDLRGLLRDPVPGAGRQRLGRRLHQCRVPAARRPRRPAQGR